MSDLLSFAVSAHGGLDHWNTFPVIPAAVTRNILFKTENYSS